MICPYVNDDVSDVAWNRFPVYAIHVKLLPSILSRRYVSCYVDMLRVTVRTTGITRRVRQIAKSDCYLLHVYLPLSVSVCPSVRIRQHGFHRSDFHEIWYLITFRNSRKFKFH